MTGRLEGKVAIVTGGASGIGAATCRRFVEEGARLVMTDIDPAGEDIVKELGGDATFLLHDVSNETRWREVVAETVQRHGGLDILVNCAGLSFYNNIEDGTGEQWRRMFAINADSIFYGCAAAFPELKKRQPASIVNVASSSSVFGYSVPLAYASAKSAQQGFTRSLTAYCREHGYDIRCNIVMPSAIESPMLRRHASDYGVEGEDGEKFFASLGRPVDVGNMILFLASDEGRFVRGEMILVDGGKCYSQDSKAAMGAR